MTVTSVERVAEDAACVSVEIPPALREAYAFHAGQYVTVRRMIAGSEERRTYSIVTPPGGGALKLGIRLQTGGRMSGELGTALRPGDLLDVGTPMGRFRTAISPEREHSYVAFAAGSGITPILSLATDILAREPRSRFTLIYGNRSMSRTMFLEQILALKNLYIERFSAHFLMSREPQQTEWLNGRVNGDKIRELAQHMMEIGTADEYLICGPGTMVDEVRDAIKELNGDAPIRFERFAAGTPRTAASAAAASDSAAASGAAPVPQELLATISVVMDGRRRSFPMTRSDASVLAAGERAGLVLPFSCRSGICATCRARITGGAAVMTHNIALEPWETAAGFVLCCQARPTTPTLEISYDHK
ncbi:MAG TPA: 2Fe-2S iron-sulfur cluster-binding protein [Steroidobacteraceae bacterium]|nr:2Fe-2S iron-sulfur cluster-binding protein [Steroidobacteraceae bacterium]